MLIRVHNKTQVIIYNLIKTQIDGVYGYEYFLF